MDLIEEEDGLPAAQREPFARTLDDLAHLGAADLDRAVLLEGGIGGLGHEPGQRGLAGTRRPVEDHRVGVPLLDRPPQRRARPQQMVLPDELVERLRPQPRCQGNLT